MNTFINLIHVLTFYMIFDLYVKGTTMLLLEQYTDEHADVLGPMYYYGRVSILILFCTSMFVDQMRILG